MNFLSVIMLGFAIIGGIDRIFGNRLKLGGEFEKGFYVLGDMGLSMVGMIILLIWLSFFRLRLIGFMPLWVLTHQ